MALRVRKVVSSVREGNRDAELEARHSKDRILVPVDNHLDHTDNKAGPSFFGFAICSES